MAKENFCKVGGIMSICRVNGKSDLCLFFTKLTARPNVCRYFRFGKFCDSLDAQKAAETQLVMEERKLREKEIKGEEILT